MSNQTPFCDFMILYLFIYFFTFYGCSGDYFLLFDVTNTLKNISFCGRKVCIFYDMRVSP